MTTTYVVNVSYESKVRGMRTYKTDQRIQNRRLVMMVLHGEQVPLSSVEIKIKIDKYLIKIRKMETGNVYEKRAKYSCLNPSLRTIQRILKLLLEKKVLEIKNRKYGLTLMAQDLKRWSKDFWQSILIFSAKSFFPSIMTVEQNVDNLITMFGTSILFYFMEISRRASEIKDDNIMPLYERDKIILEALNDFFDPMQMYRMFLATVKSQPTKEEIQMTIKNRFEHLEDGKSMRYIDEKGRRRSPPSIDDYAYEHFLYECDRNPDYLKANKSVYELDSDQVSQLERVLKKRNAFLFTHLLDAKHNTLPVKFRSQVN